MDAGRIVVGIAGGSASGKTTVVRELSRLLQPVETAVLSHDAYYRDLSHLPVRARAEVNVDHPDSLETDLLVEHVVALRSGATVEMPAYDFIAQTRGPTGIVVGPAPVIVVEGMLTLHDGRLRDVMDVTVFIDANEDDRLSRRIARDVAERGRDRAAVLQQHRDRVQPMHERFVEPSRVHADVVIEGGAHNVEGVTTLAATVRLMLR